MLSVERSLRKGFQFYFQLITDKKTNITYHWKTITRAFTRKTTATALPPTTTTTNNDEEIQ